MQGPTSAGLLLLSLAAPLAAQTKAPPHMEVGIGVAALGRPDYRGSEQYGVSVLPLPYLIYRSDRLSVSREGVWARLFDREAVQLGVSLAATLPGKRDGEPARQGMPELLPTLEAGPSLDWCFLGQESPACICLPVRAVLATDLSRFEPIGWLAHPHAKIGHGWKLDGGSALASVSFGPLWASQAYHAYFYEVAPRYATPQRPEYRAHAGYSGARASVLWSWRRAGWRAGLGIFHDILSGAVVADSPLIQTRHATTVFLGLSYALWSVGGDIPP